MGVLVSIAGRHCANIFNGKKKIELRKDFPCRYTSFTVYVYVTKGTNALLNTGAPWSKVFLFEFPKACLDDCSSDLCGKVIGQFDCERVHKFLYYDYLENLEEISKAACLTKEEVCDYFNREVGYVWEISNVKFYDEPKTLSDFHLLCGKFIDCEVCKDFMIKSELVSVNDKLGLDIKGDCRRRQPLKRAPQSWCYVGDLV